MTTTRRLQPAAILRWLHPRQIMAALDDIDATAPSYTMSRPAALRRVFAVLACISLCLLLIHYVKFSNVFVETTALLSRWQDLPANHYYMILRRSGFLELAGYAWWTAWHVVGYLLIPALLIKLLWKDRVRDYGWRWNDTGKHWAGYALLLSPILLFVVIASFNRDFLAHYPFYKQSGRSWFDFIAWEALYLCQFLCLEFFFRGFFLQALRPAIGANAVWVMCVPYLMIHFPKLWPEAFGAISFGLFLGILALRSRSIWGGFFVHAGIAVGMDVASLVQQGKLPSVFWPL